MNEENDREDDDNRDRGRWVAELQVEQEVGEVGQAEVDAGGHRDLAQQIEPAGEPAPPRPVIAAELRRPVVEPSGGRVAGADLSHGQADDRDHDAYEWPAEGDD